MNLLRLERGLTAQPHQTTPNAQQRAFDQFRTEYNHERPHEALEMHTPSQHYQYSQLPTATARLAVGVASGYAEACPTGS